VRSVANLKPRYRSGIQMDSTNQFQGEATVSMGSSGGRPSTDAVRGVSCWIGMWCAAAAEAIVHASIPVTDSPWPASACTVTLTAVNILDSPRRRGERTNTS
jgi:hypothetical protein